MICKSYLFYFGTPSVNGECHKRHMCPMQTVGQKGVNIPGPSFWLAPGALSASCGWLNRHSTSFCPLQMVSYYQCWSSTLKFKWFSCLTFWIAGIADLCSFLRDRLRHKGLYNMCGVREPGDDERVQVIMLATVQDSSLVIQCCLSKFYESSLADCTTMPI